jgi:hypothetical protein
LLAVDRRKEKPGTDRFGSPSGFKKCPAFASTLGNWFGRGRQGLHRRAYADAGLITDVPLRRHRVEVLPAGE